MNYTREVVSAPDGSVTNRAVGSLHHPLKSAGDKVQGTFWEGTSNRLPHMVGSHSLLVQPELRAEVLEARDLFWQPPSQVTGQCPAVPGVTTSPDFLSLTYKIENLCPLIFLSGPLRLE